MAIVPQPVAVEMRDLCGSVVVWLEELPNCILMIPHVSCESWFLETDLRNPRGVCVFAGPGLCLPSGS